MSKKYKCCKWQWLLLGLALAVAILTVLYGQGVLNLGMVRRVALVECRGESVKEGNSCIYTLEPIHYFVIKDGANFLIYDSNYFFDITNILKDNNIKMSEGGVYPAVAYSISHEVSFTDITLGYKMLDKNGVKLPAFILDGATRDSLPRPRSVTVALPGSNVKIRFNTIAFP